MNHGRMHMPNATGPKGEDHSSHEHFICNACGSAFHSELELKNH